MPVLDLAKMTGSATLLPYSALLKQLDVLIEMQLISNQSISQSFSAYGQYSCSHEIFIAEAGHSEYLFRESLYILVHQCVRGGGGREGEGAAGQY